MFPLQHNASSQQLSINVEWEFPLKPKTSHLPSISQHPASVDAHHYLPSLQRISYCFYLFPSSIIADWPLPLTSCLSVIKLSGVNLSLCKWEGEGGGGALFRGTKFWQVGDKVVAFSVAYRCPFVRKSDSLMAYVQHYGGFYIKNCLCEFEVGHIGLKGTRAACGPKFVIHETGNLIFA